MHAEKENLLHFFSLKIPIFPHLHFFSCYNNLDLDPDPTIIYLDQIHWQKPVVFPDACDVSGFKKAKKAKFLTRPKL
jgi:hypothetical protein